MRRITLYLLVLALCLGQQCAFDNGSETNSDQGPQSLVVLSQTPAKPESDPTRSPGGKAVEVTVSSEDSVQIKNLHNLYYAVDIIRNGRDGAQQVVYEATMENLLQPWETRGFNIGPSQAGDQFVVWVYGKKGGGPDPRRDGLAEQVAWKNFAPYGWAAFKAAIGPFGVILGGEQSASLLTQLCQVVDSAVLVDQIIHGRWGDALITLGGVMKNMETAPIFLQNVLSGAGISLTLEQAKSACALLSVLFIMPRAIDNWNACLNEQIILQRLGSGIEVREQSDEFIRPPFRVGQETPLTISVRHYSGFPVYNAHVVVDILDPTGNKVEGTATPGTPGGLTYRCADSVSVDDPVTIGSNAGSAWSAWVAAPAYSLTTSSLGHTYRGGKYHLRATLYSGGYDEAAGATRVGSAMMPMVIADATAPEPPGSVAAMQAGSDVLVSWSWPSGEWDLERFVIGRAQGPDSTPQEIGSVVVSTSYELGDGSLEQIDPKVVNTFTDSGTLAGRTYYYCVKGIDWAGNEGLWSQMVRVSGEQDECPNDPNKTEPGNCGCGSPEMPGCGFGSDMVLIPAGEFLMGDQSVPYDGDADERPVHEVYVDAFYMDRTEITNQQYVDALNWAKDQGNLVTIFPTTGVVCSYNHNYNNWAGIHRYCETTPGSPFSRITWNDGTFGVVSGKQDYPVVEVTWYGAVAYANWRSAMQGRPLCYDLSTWNCNFGGGYRLPTEAEWEKAARGGAGGHRFPWSDTDAIRHAWANYYSYWSGVQPYLNYDTSPTSGFHPLFAVGVGNNLAVGDKPFTSPVAYFAPNGYGLYDMAGNASEWCNDRYSGSYYSSTPYNNPRGPTSGSHRVFRGGSFFDRASECRVAHRDHTDPLVYGAWAGIRLVVSSP